MASLNIDIDLDADDVATAFADDDATHNLLDAIDTSDIVEYVKDNLTDNDDLIRAFNGTATATDLWEQLDEEYPGKLRDFVASYVTDNWTDDDLWNELQGGYPDETAQRLNQYAAQHAPKTNPTPELDLALLQTAVHATDAMAAVARTIHGENSPEALQLAKAAFHIAHVLQVATTNTTTTAEEPTP